jgi:midasin (ATPase involved in ribosome maturation)
MAHPGVFNDLRPAQLAVHPRWLIRMWQSVLIKQRRYNGAQLVEFAVNSDIDTMDLVGGYEQILSDRF